MGNGKLYIDELENRLTLLMINTEESFVMIDKELVIVAFNDEFKKQYLKYLNKEVLKGTSILNYVQPGREEIVRGIYQRVFNGEVMESEIEIPLPDKTVVTYHTKYKPAFNEEGAIIGAFISGKDITELKWANQQRLMFESHRTFDNDNLKALINNTHDAMWSVDVDFRLITGNEAFDNIVRFMGGEPYKNGDNILAGFPEDHLEKFKNFYKRAFSGEVFTIVEYSSEPEEVWSEISFYPISNNGKIVGTACHSRNISDRKVYEREILRVKTELEKNEYKLKESQKIAHLGSWELDMLTGVTTWSDELFDIFGTTPQQTQPSLEAYFSFIHSGDVQKVKDMIDEANASLISIPYSHRIVRPDGTIRTVYCESRFTFNDKHTPLRINGIIHDITDRKLADENIKLIKERYDVVAKATNDAIWDLDLVGNKLFWGDGFNTLFGDGLDAKIVNLELWAGLIHEDERKIVYDSLMKVIKSPDGTRWEEEYRFMKSNGTYANVLDRGFVIRNSKGKAIRVIGAMQDITVLKGHIEQLQKLLDVTNEQNKKLQNFAHIVSHNIRSHSVNINGLVEMIDDTLESEEKMKYYAMLKSSTGKLNETIENLSNIITIQNDINKVRTVLNLKIEVDKTCDAINSVISQTNTTVINQVDPGIDINVIPSYLESILLNIITNAIKYRMKDRPAIIKLYTQKTGNYILLNIEDNGMGIDMEKNGDKLFGMYKTFHSNSDARGFGLFITKNQIEAMNGKIELESEPGKGSIFKIYFNEKN
ncbi:MAG: PAS domain S-box protein [Bacteroidota bacterium]